jgi:integrase
MLSTATPTQLVHDQASVEEWLYLLSCLGRAPATVLAYRRCLIHYLAYCRASRVAPEGATLENVSLYVRTLLPGSATSIANSSLHQRLTAIRLWYDHLVYQGVCEKNPVVRGRHSSASHPIAHEGFARGLVQRLVKLPHVPSDEEWGALLRVASTSSVRNRLMLALGYYGALRRSELLGLQISDLDPAHRLVSLRAETTKGKRARIVGYSPTIGAVLMMHLRAMRSLDPRPGPLFRSESDRNAGKPLSIWSWSKIVRAWSLSAGIPGFSTHSLRHLRLTHLARSGWKLHELTSYAGHRDPKTTMIYLHLSGGDLAARMAGAVAHIDARVHAELFPKGLVAHGE